MSANNIVRIKEYKESPKYRVRDEDIECGCGYDVGSADTLEEAVKIANKYEEEEFVEYGITIDLIKNI